MDKINRSATDIAKAVQAILNDEGLYSPVLDMAIEDYAQVSVLKAIAFEDATMGFPVRWSQMTEARMLEVDPWCSSYLVRATEDTRSTRPIRFTSTWYNRAEDPRRSLYDRQECRFCRQ